MPTRFQGEEGANAVEFALLLPILLMLVFGTMFGASMFNSQQTVTQAAREGARFGATFPLDCTGANVTAPPANCWFDEVAARVNEVLAPDRPLTAPGPVVVCVRFYEASGTAHPAPGLDPGCPAATPAGGMEGPRVEVTAIRPARLELGITTLPPESLPPFELTGSVFARYELTMDP